MAKFDIVDMGLGAVFIDKDQLMLGAVEAAHAGICLGPDAQVLELGIGTGRGFQDLAHMPPVHADKVDRAIGTECLQLAKCLSQKVYELGSGHFAGGHIEFAMLDLARARNVAANLDVIGRVREDHLCLFRSQ